ncbi:hypothetical protein BGZ97_000908 [Linnemannia gamsii]|uniref:RNI-like protein n=1 Tax=Linnemannia gamsii TaxID=64522 RepID=A0A9P6QXC9_9FUNG|nr:hypothetical protein BGZ97_000908 [Linnemannia gamsii]
MSLQAQKQLVRRNPGLEMMAWEGSASLDGLSLDRLDVEDFAKLANLQDLRLVRWDGSGGALVQVLRATARTLEVLELIDVVGFEERDPAVTSAATKAAGGGGDELELEVGVDVFDLTRLAYTLKTRCPKLHTLTIQDSRDENDPGLSFGTLIRGCRDFSSLLASGGCGLVKIELSTMAYDAIDRDVIASILTHKATLEDLALDYYCEELQQRAFDAKDILKILVECRQLRSFTISGSTGLSTLATLKVLRSRPWGCLELAELDMDFEGGELPWSAPSTSHKPRGGGGGGGGGKGKSSKKKKASDTTPANISSTVSYMGWYCHPQDSSFLFEEDAVQIPKTTLREAFSMVKELRSLVFLTLNLVTYTRSPDPRVMDYF